MGVKMRIPVGCLNAALAFCVVLNGGVALAQGGYLDRGKEFLKGFGTTAPGASVLGEDEIANGLREALRVGAERVVGTLGVKDGFNGSADVHIPLPGTLRTVQQTLSRFGMGAVADELELRLNRGAEAAVPRARRLFGNAIRDMTLEDVRRIYEGPKDAATQYFKAKMSASLAAEMKPIVEQELAGVGAIQTYDRMMGQYRSMPFVPDVKADLTQYVLKKTIDGVFLYLGREEAAIRDNPVKRTTALLKKVFGAQ